MFGKSVKRSKHGATLLILALIFTLAVAPGAFALNANQIDGSSTGNKPLTFNGYYYDYTGSTYDLDQIVLYFDKTMSSGTDVVAGQFTVAENGF